MEMKKNPKADMQRHTGLFLEIGLALSLALVLGVISYTVREKNTSFLTDNRGEELSEELLPINTYRQETPPPPKEMPKIAEIINIIDDPDVEIPDDIWEVVDPEDNLAVDIIPMDFTEEVVEDEVPFITAEVMPEFPGGIVALQKYIAQHVVFPEVAKQNGAQGKVYVSFVIGKTGEVEDVKILRGVDPALDKEAIRVVKSLPKWKPGSQRGKAVRVAYNVPISFKLN
ncbi:MAG: energy transducer TonB [Salinivirgaceae bacterium]|nr:energy transducer TonB [Salinivirgaceae bacterium]